MKESHNLSKVFITIQTVKYSQAFRITGSDLTKMAYPKDWDTSLSSTPYSKRFEIRWYSSTV